MKPTGTFFGIPYDWRWPTVDRIKQRVWNRQSNHILVPKVFGAGWTVNWHALFKKLRLID